MRTVRKIKLDLKSPTVARLPRAWWLVCALEESDGPYLWVRLDDEDPSVVDHQLSVLGIGNQIPSANSVFLATIKTAKSGNYHVFDNSIESY